MSNKPVAVKVENLSKSFQIPLEASSGLKQKLINFLKGKKGYRTFTPLNDVSFEIHKGDFFGIVGKNGSGKSTLLKTIAGIYTPTKGSVQVEGTLVPFIELGVGFNPELTGRENVFLNGALLGFSHDEMESMYDEIVDFAEIGDFMDEKLKNYSSGMQVRLAFSIAIRAKSDVLLLDEVLAVGDAAFQAKCFDYFYDLRQSDSTVVFISHDRSALERFCNRGVLIDQGQIVASGKMSDVLDAYTAVVLGQMDRTLRDTRAHEGAESVELKSIELMSKDKTVKTLEHGQPASVQVAVKFHQDTLNPIIGITLWKKGLEGHAIYAANNLTERLGELGIVKKDEELEYTIALPDNINDGEYLVEVGIANDSVTRFLLQHKDALRFKVFGSGNPHSVVATTKNMTIQRNHNEA